MFQRLYLKCNCSVCIMSWMEMWGIAWTHPTMDTVRTACPLDGSFVCFAPASPTTSGTIKRYTNECWYMRWINIIISTLNRRNICTSKTTSYDIKRLTRNICTSKRIYFDIKRLRRAKRACPKTCPLLIIACAFSYKISTQSHFTSS